MSERCDITLRQAEGTKPNPDDILDKVINEVTELGKIAAGSGKKWLKAKADQESIRVKEIQARILQGVALLDLQRQKQLQDYELERQRIANAHAKDTAEFTLKQQQQCRQAILDAVKVIKDFHDMGIDVDLQVINEAPKSLFEGIIAASVAVKKLMKERE